MKSPAAFIPFEVDFNTRQAAIRAVRESVFVREQGVPLEMEWDGLDEHCMQLLVINESGTGIATARMTMQGHVGRMAVLPDYRGRGIGTAMLRQFISTARKRNLAQVWLNAQTNAVEFYRRLGFVAEGNEFDDAGIPHLRMTRIP